MKTVKDVLIDWAVIEKRRTEERAAHLGSLLRALSGLEEGEGDTVILPGGIVQQAPAPIRSPTPEENTWLGGGTSGGSTASPQAQPPYTTPPAPAPPSVAPAPTGRMMCNCNPPRPAFWYEKGKMYLCGASYKEKQSGIDCGFKRRT